MIHFERNEKIVNCVVENGPIGFKFLFSFDCEDKFYAELLQRHFQNNLWSRMEAIRKKAYDQGYKDGRAKSAKQQYFQSSLNL